MSSAQTVSESPRKYQLFIDGKWVDAESGKTFTSPNPSTGETLAEVQNRLLPVGTTVNGVFVANDQTAVPLFTAIPGYGLVSLRGGWRFSESQEVTFDFENIADKSHRAPGWGVDGPGRSITGRYQFRF